MPESGRACSLSDILVAFFLEHLYLKNFLNHPLFESGKIYKQYAS
jgi:hypothetical protein